MLRLSYKTAPHVHATWLELINFVHTRLAAQCVLRCCRCCMPLYHTASGNMCISNSLPWCSDELQVSNFHYCSERAVFACAAASRILTTVYANVAIDTMLLTLHCDLSWILRGNFMTRINIFRLHGVFYYITVVGWPDLFVNTYIEPLVYTMAPVF